jgi:retinol dehydrogenase-12
MAKSGARVIIACRSLPKAREAQRAMIAASGNSDIVAKELDVSSFESVRKFASEILKEERQLNILINNAGMLAGMFVL